MNGKQRNLLKEALLLLPDGEKYGEQLADFF